MIKYLTYMNSSKQKYTYHFFLAAAVIAAAYILLYALLEQGIFSHSMYDSYTRQAASWWQGSSSLPENISWLEIAEYNGKYFVSFPPFPSVIQFLLYPIFGSNTPNNLANTLFALSSFVLIYRFFEEREYGGFISSVFALLTTLGTNLFYLSITGWVWFSAQTQSFFLCVLCIYLIYSKKKTAWYFSFLCLGLAVACRPFQIVYVPLLFYLLYFNMDTGKGVFRTILSCAKYAIPLVLVGVCIAAYNYLRFDSLIEFGHNYLPEFANERQFSLQYVPGNFLEILKLPSIESKELVLPKLNGTLFFLVNPVFILLAVSMIKNKLGAKKFIYSACLIAHFVLLLSHRTMGGWQFGSRYLIDMVPFMLIMFADNKGFYIYKRCRKDCLENGEATADETSLLTEHVSKTAILPVALTVIGMAINIYGAIWFYTMA